MRSPLVIILVSLLAITACDTLESADVTAQVLDDPGTPEDGSEDPAEDPGEDPAEDPIIEPTEEPIVEPLPVDVILPEVWGSPVLVDENPEPGVVEVSITAASEMIEIYEGRMLEMLTYNGLYPGPMLQARVGDRIIVHFTNELDEPTTVHWHGLKISDEMDGNPRIQDPVEPGETFVYDFVVNQTGSYWYHPHVNTQQQIEKGLYAPMVIHEAEETVVDAQRYILFDDILLDDDGFPPFLATHHEKMHGRVGNLLVTNGSGDVLELEAPAGSVERWRVVNSSNARTMYLTFEGMEWRVMGTDGGLIPEPYSSDFLQVAVGQRFDLEIRYTDPALATVQSWVFSVDEAGDVVQVPIEVTNITLTEPAETPTIVSWPAAEPLPIREVNAEGWMEFDAVEDPVTGVKWTINGESMPMEPVLTYWQGDTVNLALFNRLGPEHPFHLHGQFFEIIRRNGQLVFDEPGLKDTVLIPGKESVHVRAYMDNPGSWMAHCHIPAHAKLGMMGEVLVLPNGQ